MNKNDSLPSVSVNSSSQKQSSASLANETEINKLIDK